MSDKPILLVDSMNYFIRHFCVNPSISNNGEPIGGVVGSMKGMNNLIDQIMPKKIFFIWEGGGSVRKRSIYKNYKNRKRPMGLNRFYGDEMPNTVQNRNWQIAILVKMLSAAGGIQIYVGDCEADDVIGYLVKYKFKDENIVIASSDRDYYQLLNDRVKIWSLGRKILIDEEYVKKEFNISPVNFCTSRCFIGDPSDGIEGIKGAGFKSLAKRFPELKEDKFISVQEIIDKAETLTTISKIKLYKNICEDPFKPKLNWKLMNLDVNNLSATHIQKVDDLIDTLEPSYNKIQLMKLITSFGIKNFNTDLFFMKMRSCKY